MVKNRTEQARQLGYENYVELGYYRMNRNCYDKEMVENFRKQVKEYFVPFANKLHEQRRQRIGVEKLSYIDTDVYFTNGNPAPVGTPEEILAAGQKMYSELSPQTKEFFDFMMENELFDVLGRKTKRQGGYMTYIPNFKSPFIFANFNGTSGDVDVITHECGHAFQGYLLRDEEIREFADITMETAEIHSMSMEYFTYNWMELFFWRPERRLPENASGRFRCVCPIRMYGGRVPAHCVRKTGDDTGRTQGSLGRIGKSLPPAHGLRRRSFLWTRRLLAETAAHFWQPVLLY